MPRVSKSWKDGTAKTGVGIFKPGFLVFLVAPLSVTVLASLAMLALAFLPALSSPSVSASNMSVSVTAPNTTRIATLGYYILISNSGDVDIDINAVGGGSSGVVGTGVDTLYVYTNSPSGYQLYISSDQAEDVDEDHPGNALYKGGTLGADDFFAPTTSTVLSTNSWGYYNSSSDLAATSSFSAVPLYSDMELIKETSSANHNADADDTSVKEEITYGARANVYIPSGSYSGSVVYTALAEASSSSSGEATITPDSTEMIVETTPVTITTSLYTNATDLGEITAYIGTNENEADECGNLSWSLEDDTLLVIECEAPTRDLDLTTSYDVWVNVPKYDRIYKIEGGFTYENTMEFWSIENMQEMTPNICAWATTPLNTAGKTTAYLDTTGDHQGDTTYVAQRTLYDIRTGTSVSYTIRKLADGNCWMTSNLALPLTAGVEVTASKNDGTTFSWTPIGGCGTNTNGNCAMNGNTRTPYSNGEYYYSWMAATAGTGTTSMTMSSGDAEGSICPAGWKLPTNYVDKDYPEGGAPKSYSSLLVMYGLPVKSTSSNYVSTLEGSPLNFVRKGNVYNGTIGMTSYGNYWTSTSHTSLGSHAAYFTYSTTFAYLQNNNYKINGYQVRCVAI